MKEAKKPTEVTKGLILNDNNVQTDPQELKPENYLKIRKNSFDHLMDNMLILDRSIFEYKFIFAKNLEGSA